MNDDRLKNQMHFISLLLTNKTLVSNWVDGQPSIKYFDKTFRIILDAIRDANEHGVLLTRKSYQNYVLNLYKNKKTAIGEETLYNRISSFPVNIDDFPMLQSKIIDSFLAQNAADLIQQFPKNQEKKGNLLAVKKLSDDLSGLFDEQSGSHKEMIYENVLDFMPDYIQKIKDYKSGKIKEDSVLGCGIREIDDTMLNGFAPGTLTLFCGDIGGFKSTMMLNVALNIWKDKKENVLFVPLEMTRGQVIEKMVSRETQINFEKIVKKKHLTDEEVKKIEDTTEEWVKLPSQIYFLEYMERIKVSIIRREIDKHIELFKPRLVVIDYIANLIPDLSRDGRNDLEIGDMLKDLRSMGKAYNFAIVSGAQIGREALKRLRRSQSDKMMAYSEDIRGSHEYSADADNIYAQFPDPTNPTERLQFFVIKARNGKKVFRDNQTSAVLEVKPEISLIRSLDWTTADTGDILKKVDDAMKDISFEKKPADDKKKVKSKDVNSIFSF